MLLIAEGHDDWHHADLSSLRLSSLAYVMVPLAVGKHNLNDSIAAGLTSNESTPHVPGTVVMPNDVQVPEHAAGRKSPIK